MEFFFSTTFGTLTTFSLLVIFFDKLFPISRELLKVSCKLKIPFADPTVVSFCLDLPGMKASISLSNFDLPPDYEVKCMEGVQKPETQIQSHFIFSIFPKVVLSSDIFAMSADLTFL